MLDIRGLKTHFKTDDGWLHAVDGVDIAIDAGETLGVVGESGCGKSVTAKTVMKLIDMPPGQDRRRPGAVAGPRPGAAGRPEAMQKIRAKEIAIIFQEPMTSLNPVYTVGEQIAESVRLHEGPVAQGRDGPRGRDAAAGAHPHAPNAACATTRTSSAAACASA